MRIAPASRRTGAGSAAGGAVEICAAGGLLRVADGLLAWRRLRASAIASAASLGSWIVVVGARSMRCSCLRDALAGGGDGLGIAAAGGADGPTSRVGAADGGGTLDFFSRGRGGAIDDRRARPLSESSSTARTSRRISRAVW